MQIILSNIFWVVGGLGCVGVKLNVVQKCWLCVLACTSFNFTKRWLFCRFLSECSMFVGCLLGLQLTSRGLASVGDLVSQMYKLKTELASTKPTLKFA
ncbi:hypothetical protein AS885_11490 [Flavobacterium psychrophilum]|nr:hypothetical protein AS885_11490 [Flavobacterium psychrophilum]